MEPPCAPLKIDFRRFPTYCTHLYTVNNLLVTQGFLDRFKKSTGSKTDAMIADEQQPLLAAVPETTRDGIKHTGVILGFGDGDPENPREWPILYKWAMVSLLAFSAFTV